MKRRGLRSVSPLYDDVLHGRGGIAGGKFVFDQDLQNTGYPAKYLSLPATSGAYASSPDSDALDVITGDLDVRVKIALDDWTPSSIQYYFNKYVSAANGTFLMNISTGSTGLPGFEWVSSGTLRSVASTAAPTVSDSGILWLRWTLDVNDGAGGHAANCYTSINYEPYHESGVWTKLGSTRTAGAFTTSVDASTALLRVGSFSGAPPSSKVYYADIRNGIDGAIVARFDPTDGLNDATSFTSSTGEVWTINGTAELTR